MSANIKASVDGTQAIIGVGGVDQMTVSNAGVVTANSFVGNVTGGGAFSGNASSSTALATGSTTARTLANRFADVVNVLDFGAVGDGVTDDTAAIQAAFNSSKDSIYFPEGLYKITANLARSGNTQIIGQGLNSSKIIFSGNYSLNYNGGAGGDNYTMSHLNVENISFECTVVNTGALINAEWIDGIGNTAKSTSFRNVNFSGTSGTGGFAHGLRLKNARNVRLDNLRFLGDRSNTPFTSGNGITIIGDAPNGAPVEFFLDAVQCFFLNTGIQVSGFVEGLYVDKSSFIACNNGIIADGTASGSGRPLLFVNNSHFNTGKRAIENTFFVQTNISHNSFYAIDYSGTSTEYKGIVFNNNGADLSSQIKDNDFKGIISTIPKTGIQVANDTSFAENISIFGNEFVSFNNGIVMGAATSSGVIGDDNLFFSVTTPVTNLGTNRNCVTKFTPSISSKTFPDSLQVKFGESIVTLNGSGDGTISLVGNEFPTACLTALVNNGDPTSGGNLVFSTSTLLINGINFSVRPNPGAVPVRVRWVGFGN
jgi:hypothetical protein